MNDKVKIVWARLIRPGTPTEKGVAVALALLALLLLWQRNNIVAWLVEVSR